MSSSKFFLNAIVGLVNLIFTANVLAMSANPILSRNKTVYTSNGNSAFLVDNKFMGTDFKVSANSWVALNLGSGPSKVIVNWNSPADAWSNELAPASCPKSNSFPIDYDLLKSSNSTNGSDGTWTVVQSITNNIVIARGHILDFSGASWVKMAIKKGGGSIDEFEVFDASKGADDFWFFAGTSITQMTFKSYSISANFADKITSSHAGFNPAIVRGGIGCINSSDMVKNLNKYLAMSRVAHYWAIEMGTNDGWGGTNSNVNTFTKNMQLIVDSCKASGIIPILAHTLATNPAKTENGWQIHNDYIKAIDDLTSKNKLPTGPDFFAWFKSHPDELNSDGVHPNATGAASIQKLWADAASTQYTATGISRPNPISHSNPLSPFSVLIRSGTLEILAAQAGTAFFYDLHGSLLDHVGFDVAGKTQLVNFKGVILIRYVTINGIYTQTAMAL